MRFEIDYTSRWKAKCWRRTIDKAIKTTLRRKRNVYGHKSNFYTVEVTSIEQLVDLMDKTGSPIILRLNPKPEIEIYNDHKEHETT